MLISHRMISLINKLMNDKQVVSGEKLAKQLHVSSRTIRNDINAINELDSLGAKINSIIGRGYFLEIQDSELLQKNLQLYRKGKKLLNEAGTAERLFEELGMILSNTLFLSNISNREMCDCLYISDSTLRNDLNLLVKQYLETGVTLTKHQNKIYQLDGDEIKVRANIINLITKHQNRFAIQDNASIVNLIPSYVLDPIKKVTKQAMELFDYRFSDEGFTLMVLHLSLGVLRKNKHILVNPKYFYQQNIMMVESILKQIDAHFGSDLIKDIHFYKPLFLSLNTMFDFNTDHQLIEQLEKIVLNGIDTITKKLKIDFSHDFILINGLVLHLCNTIERVQLNMTFYNQTVDYIKLNYPVAFEISVLFSQILSRELKMNVDDNEIGLIAIHFGGSLERLNNQAMTLKKAVIVCGYGIATAMLVKERIKSEFGNQLEIVGSLNYDEFLNFDTQDIDFIFTTIPLKDGDQSKMIFIDLALSEHKVKEIVHTIKQIEIKEDLKSLFYPELFIKEVDLISKEEVITYLTDLMCEKGYMSEHAFADIMAREQLSSTEIGHGIAIPHYLNLHNNICAIGVLTLKKPILWHKEKVELILLMSLSPDHCGAWERVFRSLYPLITSEYWVKQVVNEFGFEQFIDSIKNHQL